MYRFYIFDVDGTLIDSMPMWHELGRLYLASKGKDSPADLYDTIELMTLNEVAEFFIENYGITDSVEQIKADIAAVIYHQNSEVIEPIEAPLEELRKLQREGARMIALSTSDADCIRATLERLGVLEGFEAIYSADDFGLGKDKPEIWRMACEMHGVSAEETAVYEDSAYAMEAAAAAGCTVIDATKL